MATNSMIQVLEKNDYRHQFFCTLPASTPLLSLGPSSVRVRTRILALTTNSITYAIGGSFLHWWETYPVPDSVEAPYNDHAIYGTVPGWGYATVLESTTSIKPGTLLKGYFPVSTVPSDLQLTAAPVPGHWIETSQHRAQVMPLYHRYIVSSFTPSSSPSSKDLDSMAWESLIGILWECAYLINHFVFNAKNTLSVHPSGTNSPWTAVDAELKDATVILLAASGKTALLFADQLRNARAPGNGPLAVIGVTSATSLSFVQGTSFYTSVLSYDELDQAPASVADNTKRIVLVDFGARGRVAEDLISMLEVQLPSAPLMMIRIGSELKPQKSMDMGVAFAGFEGLRWIQANTSGLRDKAMEKTGEEKYFAEMSNAWQAVKERNGGPVPGMELSWGEGMVGESGVEGGWKKLCAGDVTPEKGMVIKL